MATACCGFVVYSWQVGSCDSQCHSRQQALTDAARVSFGLLLETPVWQSRIESETGASDGLLHDSVIIVSVIRLGLDYSFRCLSLICSMVACPGAYVTDWIYIVLYCLILNT